MRGRFLVVFSLTILLGGCSVGSADYDARFLEKYLLDGERALQENDAERAERLFRLAVSHGEKLGAGNWKLALAEGRLGKVLASENRDAEAKTVLASSISHFRAAKAGNTESANLIAKERGEADALLGLLLFDSGDVNGARPYLEESAATLAPFWSQAKEERERDTLAGIGYARALYGLARIREYDGDATGAAKNYESALSVIDEERISVPIREDIAAAYAKLLTKIGKRGEAEKVEEKQEAYAKFNPGGTKAIARDAWREAYNKGREAARDNDYVKSDQYLAEAAKQVKLYDKKGEDTLQTLFEWSRTKQRMNDAAGADRLLKEAEALAIKVGGPRSVQFDNYMQAKDRVLKMQRKYDEQEVLLKEQVKLRAELRGKDNFHVGETLKRLAACRFHLNRLPEAIADMEEAIRIFKKNPQRNFKELKEAYDELIPMLEKSEDPGAAEEIRKYKFERAVLRRDIIKWDSQKHAD